MEVHSDKDTAFEYDPKKTIQQKPQKSKEMGKIIVYLSRKCPHCQKVMENWDKVKANFSDWEDILQVFVDEDKTFLCYDFEEVPTILIPMRRPYEGIAPEYLIEADKAKLIKEGLISPGQVKHEKSMERKKRNEFENKYLDYLTT
jgi:hypothetical protein